MLTLTTDLVTSGPDRRAREPERETATFPPNGRVEARTRRNREGVSVVSVLAIKVLAAERYLALCSGRRAART